jgi:hypothetical protein
LSHNHRPHNCLLFAFYPLFGIGLVPRPPAFDARFCSANACLQPVVFDELPDFFG